MSALLLPSSPEPKPEPAPEPAPARALVPFPTPGLYPDMAAELYHAIEAMSSGGIKTILRSKAHYKLARTKARVPTPQMQFGTVVHAGALEPHRFASVCVMAPKDAPPRPTSRQTGAKKPSPESREAIDFWQRFDAEAGGRIILSAEDFARAHRTIEAVQNHRGAAKLLEGALIEESYFWIDARYEVPCKCRPDARNLGGLVDLKTTQDASAEDFAKAIANYGYDTQSAHYMSGAEHVLDATPAFWAFIAAETEEPHGVATYRLDGPSVLVGAHYANLALARYAEALAEQAWPAYSDFIETINSPTWRRRVSA